MDSALRVSFVAALAMSLAGCGSSSTEPPPAPPEKTVFDPMTSQIEKVQKQVDALPKERKDNLDSAIESESR